MPISYLKFRKFPSRKESSVNNVEMPPLYPEVWISVCFEKTAQEKGNIISCLVENEACHEHAMPLLNSCLLY